MLMHIDLVGTDQGIDIAATIISAIPFVFIFLMAAILIFAIVRLFIDEISFFFRKKK